MASLPAERLEPAPPFTYSGVDFFGPFYIKERRSTLKHWGCPFTCLVVTLRAVHLEVCPDLTTDSFINAYRRFISRRGPVRSIRSDCGTNIMGARGELEQKVEALDDEAIDRFMNRQSCDWIRFEPNPPRAPHMGGVWERMVGTVKKNLAKLMFQQGEQLDQDLLVTLFTEVEAVVNSRPLTYSDMTDADSWSPITPAQLLTLKTQAVYPPEGEFVDADLYSRKRWRRVQCIANMFWSRWRREYIPLLQIRQKWNEPQSNLKIDDVVFLVEDGVPRNKWPLGRVIEVKVSSDELVRSAKVKTSKGVYERPINRLVLVYQKPEVDVNPEGKATRA